MVALTGRDAAGHRTASMVALSLIAALVLALTHLYAGNLRFLDGIPRSRWLSAASGVSVAYVFVHLLPELAEARAQIHDALPSNLRAFEDHVYVLALLGLALFYGVERFTRRSRGGGKHDASEASAGAFWLSIGSFAIYNVLIGYLLGIVAALPEAVIAAVTSFLGGGIVLNVMKEELPDERESRFWAFAAGTAAYAALLIALSFSSA